MSLNKYKLNVGVCLLLATPVLGVAQPTGVKLDSGLRLYPSIDVKYAYNSNFFATEDDEEFVSGVLVAPELKLEKKTRRLTASAGAGVEVGDFDNGSDDDYTDVELDGKFNYRAGVRHRFSGRAYGKQGHDPYGLRRTEGQASNLISRELDEYDDIKGEFGYRFGADNSQFNAGYELSYYKREYDTNREFGTRFLDHDYIGHEGAVSWNYSPKTSAVLRISQRDVDYLERPPGFPVRSATERTASVGLEWLPSGKTSGQVYVGRLKRDHDEDFFDDFSAGFWNASIEWRPRSTTGLKFETGRRSNESFFVNSSFIDTKGASVSWVQKWSAVASSTSGIAYSERDFQLIDRTDDFTNLFFNLDLRVMQQLFVTLHVSVSERDSSLDVRDYDQDVISVGFRYAP